MSVDSPSDRPNALITGLEGFTGQYLARELEQLGFRVFGTVRPGSPITNRDHFPVDLCDRDALLAAVNAIEPDIVAHLAAISFVAHGNAEQIYQTNVVGSRNLLEALAESKRTPNCVLLASSANIYGNADAGYIDENQPPAPANDYAVSKLSMEYMAKTWSERLPIVITRPFNYTGAGQAEHFLIPKIVSHFQQGKRVIELGNTDVERDFSDVRRTVDAYARLITRECNVSGEIFNVCSGQGHSLRDILTMMEEIAGYPIEIRVNQAFVRANEVKRLVGSCSKLVSTIGPLKDIPMRETLEWMFDSA